MTKEELNKRASSIANIIMDQKEKNSKILTRGSIQALIVHWFEDDTSPVAIDRLNDAIEDK